MSELATTTKEFFSKSAVKQKFEELLGKRAPAFMTSVLQIVASNELLKNADPQSVYHAAATAATLDLPLNNNLGFAYIVPYNDRKNNRQLATFQLGYKGFIQLAQRSGQFKTISATPIYKGQIVSENPLTGYEFDFTIKESKEVIGYAAYFKLKNDGFEKTLYMSKEELLSHGKKYSQTFRNNKGLWIDNEESMCLKTVLKLLLSRFAPLSVDMQTAVITDQSVIKNVEGTEVEYIDNQDDQVTSAVEFDETLYDTWKEILLECETVEQVTKKYNENPITDPYILQLFEERKKELANKK